MTRMTAATRIVLAGSFLYVVDSFLPWNRACRVQCVSFSLWHGIGILAALVAMGVAGWEVAALAVPNAARPEVALELRVLGSGFVLFLTLLKVGVDNAFLSYGAWLGITLAVTMCLSGYLTWRERRIDPSTPRTERPPSQDSGLGDRLAEGPDSGRPR